MEGFWRVLGRVARRVLEGFREGFQVFPGKPEPRGPGHPKYRKSLISGKSYASSKTASIPTNLGPNKTGGGGDFHPLISSIEVTRSYSYSSAGPLGSGLPRKT